MAFSGTLLRTMHSEPKHTGPTSSRGGPFSQQHRMEAAGQDSAGRPDGRFSALPPPFCANHCRAESDLRGSSSRLTSRRVPQVSLERRSGGDL